MKIEHLSQFLTIVETGSISKASQNLFISHQHLSRIITSLEEELQCQLLIRTSTGITLTAHGESFVKYAKEILDKYQEMQAFFHYESLPAMPVEKTLQGCCQIHLPYFFSLFLNDFFEECKSRYPDIQLQCFENTIQLPGHELHGSIYAIIGDETGFENITNGNYTKHYIGSSEIKICVHRTSELADNEIITKEAFLSQTNTLFPQNSVFQKSLGSKKILFTSSNIYQHLDSVQKNKSVCILPSYVEEKISRNYPDVVLRPFEQKRKIPIYVLYNSTAELTDTEKAVMRLWVQYMQKLLHYQTV